MANYDDSGPASGGDDLYSDSGNAAPETKESSDKQTALLPKEFFQGKDLSPGTECKVKIVSVQEDQVEVSYVPHSSESETTEEPKAEVPAAEDMADLMA